MTVLFATATTGYQSRAFEAAAARLGVRLVYATDRCEVLDDPWRDGAIAVDFADPLAAAATIRDRLRGEQVAGVLAAGDRPARTAAAAAQALDLRYHRLDGVHAATNKLATRGRLLAAGLPVPWFTRLASEAGLATVAERLRFPAVVKPVALSGSRGVIRADDAAALEAALARVRAILRAPDARPAEADDIVIEGFIPGRELALEGVMEQGRLRVLAIFDKPDPLDGPYFEETIYVTPAGLADAERRRVAGTIAHAALALGLDHGPIHAECRVNPGGIFVLEVAPRPIGGLCSGVLRFATADCEEISLEELLLRHARGDSLDGYGREAPAAAVMMIPVPRAGRLRRVAGLESAEAVPGIERIAMTARIDQLLVPLPEGSSYLGFIFARAGSPAAAVAALRAAHARLRFEIDAPLPIVG